MKMECMMKSIMDRELSSKKNLNIEKDLVLNYCHSQMKN